MKRMLCRSSAAVVFTLLATACSSGYGIVPHDPQANAANAFAGAASERTAALAASAPPEYLYEASPGVGNQASTDPIYNLTTGQVVRQLHLPAGAAAGAAVSKAGAFYTTFGGNGVSYALAYAPGKTRPRRIHQHYNVIGPYVPQGVNAIALDQDGNVYVPNGSDSGPGRGAVVEYDASTLKLIRAYGAGNMFASSVAFDRSGHLYTAGCEWGASTCKAAIFVFKPGQTKPWYVIGRSQYPYSLQAAIDHAGDLYVLEAQDPHPSVIEVFHPRKTTPFREMHLPGPARSFVLDSSDNLYVDLPDRWYFCNAYTCRWKFPSDVVEIYQSGTSHLMRTIALPKNRLMPQIAMDSHDDLIVNALCKVSASGRCVSSGICGGKAYDNVCFGVYPPRKSGPSLVFQDVGFIDGARNFAIGPAP